jgi:hypothetical protein
MLWGDLIRAKRGCYQKYQVPYAFLGFADCTVFQRDNANISCCNLSGDAEIIADLLKN